MPRFLVVLCDTATGEIDSHISRQNSNVDAILAHPWIDTTYRPSYARTQFWDESVDTVIDNLYKLLGWSSICVNLDEEILKDLNGGDSSVSSQMPQS